MLLELGRPDEAVDELERAARARPADAEIQLQLGNAQMALGDAAAAREHFERALTLRPEFPDALNNLGHVELQAAELEAFEAASAPRATRRSRRRQ